MNRIPSRIAFVRPVLAAALALSLASAPAHAVCNYVTLTSGVSTTTTVTTNYTFSQSNVYWAAVAVKPQAGTDWDMYLYSSTAADPACVTGQLASSAAGQSGVDYVIADFNASPRGTYYAQASLFAGGGTARVQWDDGADQLIMNDPLISRSVNGAYVIEVWDVFLDAGKPYTFTFNRGGADLRLNVFENPGGAYYVSRSAAKFEATTTTTYTPAVTGWHGVVVINNDGGTGSFTLGVGTCQTPVALSANTIFGTSGAESYFSFTQPTSNWAGVAVRSGTSSDWDLETYTLLGGTGYPTCMSGLLASSSYGAGVVDFVVGNFHHNANSTYYVRPHLYQDIGAVGATVQWTPGGDIMYVGGPFQTFSTGPGDIIRVFDMYLSAGTTYTFRMLRSGTCVPTLMLFRNPAGVYWAGRASAAFSMGVGTATYTAPDDGIYGLVVVNDNGQTGSYDIQVGTCDAPAALTAGASVVMPAVENYYSFTQGIPYWTAVGVRGQNLADDWDVEADSLGSGTTYPTCLSGFKDVSQDVPPNVDFVISDFNYTPFGTYYVRPHMFQDRGQNAGIVQWDSGSNQLVVNQPNTIRTTDGSDILEVWDVFLNANQHYGMLLWNYDGASDRKLYLFDNPNHQELWTYPGDPATQVFTQEAPGATVVNTSFTAPVTGWYGVVVVNENGMPGTYGVGIGTCDGVAVNALPRLQTQAGYDATNFYTVGAGADSLGPWWQAFGSRGGGLYGWDVNVSDINPGPAGWPVCRYPYLEYALGQPNGVSLAVGDLRSCPRPSGTLLEVEDEVGRLSGTVPGLVEWDRAQIALLAGVPVSVPLGTQELLRAYDVSLTSGTDYTFTFTHGGGSNYNVLLFRNINGTCPTSWWGQRSDAVFTLASGSATFHAPASGHYLAVVVNDDGTADTYTLRYDVGALAVGDDVAPAVTRLTGVRPNPSRGGTEIGFALHAPASVSFEVMDLGGRRVASVDRRAWAPGDHAVRWDGRASGGSRVAPGVYLVRMQVDGRMAGQEKLTILE